MSFIYFSQKYGIIFSEVKASQRLITLKMGDSRTDPKTTLSFPNVKVSSLNDNGESTTKFAFKVTVMCEYDPEVKTTVISKYYSIIILF